ncbi:MAG TPA: hypothetical protein VFZ93_09805 [Albitalea sp.]
MDKPSCAMAVLGAAAASLVFGGALEPKARAVEDAPLPPAAMAAASGVPDCARPPAPRTPVPSVVPPAGPSDAQVNASGTAAAGGAGTVPGDVRGDPCEPAKRFGDAPRAASAAAINTPTTLNRR